MARKKNASFVGSPTSDTTRDASILSRWIDNVAGDFALTFDKVTGQNGHAAGDTINHSGAGRGCPLNMPLGSQAIERPIRLVGASAETVYYILVLPVFIPTSTNGNNLYILEVDTLPFDDDEITVEVFSTAWGRNVGPVSGRVFSRGGIEANGRRTPTTYSVRFEIENIPFGWRYIAVKRKLYLDDKDTTGYLAGWRMWPSWVGAGESNGLEIPGQAATGNPYPVRSSLTPATSSADDIDAGMTAINSPLDAYVLTRLNRMINTTWEYLTGSPAPGNNTTTCATTRNHSRASFTAEPLLEFPMMSVATSCMRVTNVTAKADFVGTISAADPVEGPNLWVRYPQVTSAQTLSQSSIYFPPFKQTATTDLDVHVLILDYSTAGAGTWQTRIAIDGVLSAWVSFAQIGATNLWSATVSGEAFTSELPNTLAIQVQNTGGGAITGKEIILIGYGVAFTP